MSNTLAQILEQQSSKHQFTLIGDTNHSNLALRDKLSEEENIAALARSGVKHLFLELPTEMDPLAQQLGQGQISREAFLDEFGNQFRPNFQAGPDDRLHMAQSTATLIETARKHGITTHFADPGNGAFEVSLGIKHQGDYLINAMLADKQERDPQVYNEVKGILTNTFNITAKGEQRIVALMTDWIQQMPPEKLAQVTDNIPQISDKAIASRLDDRALAENIKAISGNEKAAIYYGHEHGQYEGGLTTMLGEENCTRLLMLGSRRHLDIAIEPKIDRQIDYKSLAGFYALEEDVFEPISLGAIDIAPRAAARPPKITPPQI